MRKPYKSLKTKISTAHISKTWLSSRNFFQGAKSIVMQISFVMLLFLDQISGRGKSFQGGQTASGGHPLPPCGRKPENESEFFKNSFETVFRASKSRNRGQLVSAFRLTFYCLWLSQEIKQVRDV